MTALGTAVRSLPAGVLDAFQQGRRDAEWRLPSVPRARCDVELLASHGSGRRQRDDNLRAACLDRQVHAYPGTRPATTCMVATP